MIRFELDEDGLWIGWPENPPLIEPGSSYRLNGQLQMEETFFELKMNRIVLPFSGILEFELVQAEADLVSDLYLTLPEEILLIDDYQPKQRELDKAFLEGTEVELAIEVDSTPLGLGLLHPLLHLRLRPRQAPLRSGMADPLRRPALVPGRLGLQ